MPVSRVTSPHGDRTSRSRARPRRRAHHPGIPGRLGWPKSTTRSRSGVQSGEAGEKATSVSLKGSRALVGALGCRAALYDFYPPSAVRFI
jgi:hypothetical protein